MLISNFKYGRRANNLEYISGKLSIKFNDLMIYNFSPTLSSLVIFSALYICDIHCSYSWELIEAKSIAFQLLNILIFNIKVFWTGQTAIRKIVESYQCAQIYVYCSFKTLNSSKALEKVEMCVNLLWISETRVNRESK